MTLYRSRLPIMVLANGDNHDAAVNIPQGATFRLVGPDRDDRFLVVRYRRKDFLVFASDLWNLCDAVSGRKPQKETARYRVTAGGLPAA